MRAGLIAGLSIATVGLGALGAIALANRDGDDHTGAADGLDLGTFTDRTNGTSVSVRTTGDPIPYDDVADATSRPGAQVLVPQDFAPPLMYDVTGDVSALMQADAGSRFIGSKAFDGRGAFTLELDGAMRDVTLTTRDESGPHDVHPVLRALTPAS